MSRPLKARASLIALAAMLWTTPGLAQSEPPWPGYVPKLFRWDEDYSALAHKYDAGLPFPLALKFIPLDADRDVYASVGGEYRFRVDSYGKPDFGLHGAADFTSLEQRLQLDADVHVGQYIRVFVQLGGAAQSGREPFARPADRSDPDLEQGFVDVNFDVNGQPWRVRAGRQELSIGRYVAVREVTDIRRAFDGMRIDGAIAGWTLMGVATYPTLNKPSAFDDTSDHREDLLALVVEHALPLTGFKVGIALLQHDNAAAHYAPGIGQEVRRTAGLRMFGASDGWDADVQVSYQFGAFTPAGKPRLSISAWGAAFEGGRTFAMPWSPRIGLRIDAASGDQDGANGVLSTFDLPYPNLSYLTDAAIFAPRNVHDLQPFVTITPAAPLTVTAGAQFLWRNSAADAVYSPINLPVIGPGGTRDYVATEPYLRVDWRINPLLEFQAGAVRALPGGALEDAGGHKAINFFFSSLAARV